MKMKNNSISIQGRSWGKTFLTNLLGMDKHPTTSSFNLANASSQDLHQMLQSGNLPSYLNSFQKQRIIELYKNGNQWDAIRKLQGLIEEQMTKPGKTLL